eukprot:Gb_14636 [translate_table: standard]
MVGSRGISPSARKDCAVMRAHDSFIWGREEVNRAFFYVVCFACRRGRRFGFHNFGLADCGGVRDNETFYWLQSNIARESLPAPWDRVVVQGMKYLTLEGKGKLPLHQGLLKMLVNYEKARITSAPLILKGKLIRTSGTLVSKALLLGLTSLIPKISADSSDSEEEEDSTSENVGVYARKKEDEKLEKQNDNLTDSKRVEKDSKPMEEIKDSTKIPPDNQNVLKELKSHLKVLNGLEGSLTGTCAYINLLTLKIANYLKEVVNRLKELNSGGS